MILGMSVLTNKIIQENNDSFLACLLVILTVSCRHESVKVALIKPVLDNTVLFKLALCKGFGDCGGHFPLVPQDLFPVELQEGIQL